MQRLKKMEWGMPSRLRFLGGGKCRWWQLKVRAKCDLARRDFIIFYYCYDKCTYGKSWAVQDQVILFRIEQHGWHQVMRVGDTISFAASCEPSAATAKLCSYHILACPHLLRLGMPSHSQHLWLGAGQEPLCPGNGQKVGMTLAVPGPRCSSLWLFNWIPHLCWFLGKWLVELTSPRSLNGWKVSLCICLWGSAPRTIFQVDMWLWFLASTLVHWRHCLWVNSACPHQPFC